MNEDYILKSYLSKIVNPKELNDDLAIISLDKSKYLITSDTINENIHFNDFDSADSVAYRLFAVNLSDIFAKGAVPLYVILNCSFKENLNKKWYDDFFNKIILLQKKFKFKIIGGDTCKAIKNSFNLTVIAKKAKSYPKRSNALIDDDLFITKEIGGSYLGLKNIKNKSNKFFQDYLYPQFTNEYNIIIQDFANASTDTSDGLYSAIENIADASNIGYKIDFNNIPFKDKKDKINQFCLSDDYQILFSAKASNYAKILEFSKRNNLKITKIGNLLPKEREIIGLASKEKQKLTKFLHKF